MYRPACFTTACRPSPGPRGMPRPPARLDSVQDAGVCAATQTLPANPRSPCVASGRQSDEGVVWLLQPDQRIARRRVWLSCAVPDLRS